MAIAIQARNSSKPKHLVAFLIRAKALFKQVYIKKYYFKYKIVFCDKYKYNYIFFFNLKKYFNSPMFLTPPLRREYPKNWIIIPG